MRFSAPLLSALLVSTGCSLSSDMPADRPEDDSALRSALSAGKADLLDRVCEEAGEPAGCDVCDVKDWYDDGICDDFCATPDPDCNPAALHCVPGVWWECDDDGEHWTGELCCVDPALQCVPGESWDCDDDGEHWTGEVCCISDDAMCIEGTSWDCDDDGEMWTGELCCLTF